jgi:transglutaminase/protease-like cytokinesis protein 3
MSATIVTHVSLAHANFAIKVFFCCSSLRAQCAAVASVRSPSSAASAAAAAQARAKGTSTKTTTTATATTATTKSAVVSEDPHGQLHSGTQRKQKEAEMMVVVAMCVRAPHTRWRSEAE